MLFRKLWNKLSGRSADPRSATDTTDTVCRGFEEKTSGQRCSTVPVRSVLRGRCDVTGGGKAPVAIQPGRAILGFGRGPHDRLCRLVRQSHATSVLEIGVGDGSRAIAVAAELVRSGAGGSIRYAALDAFEMADGGITLKQFHRMMRRHGIRPRLFPSTLLAGLRRAANTIGAVDLVLISQQACSDQETDWNRLLFRLTHSETVVLRQDDDGWTQLASPGVLKSTLCRAA
jgi:hypothetical protein